jgi:hypothetical protein
MAVACLVAGLSVRGGWAVPLLCAALAALAPLAAA